MSPSPPSDDRAQRRWLIGVAITLVFGVFGAVMAVLAYTNSTSAPQSRAPTSSPAAAPAGSTTPDPPASDKPGHGKDHGKRGD